MSSVWEVSGMCLRDIWMMSWTLGAQSKEEVMRALGFWLIWWYYRLSSGKCFQTDLLVGHQVHFIWQIRLEKPFWFASPENTEIQSEFQRKICTLQALHQFPTCIHTCCCVVEYDMTHWAFSFCFHFLERISSSLMRFYSGGGCWRVWSDSSLNCQQQEHMIFYPIWWMRQDILRRRLPQTVFKLWLSVSQFGEIKTATFHFLPSPLFFSWKFHSYYKCFSFSVIPFICFHKLPSELREWEK